MKDTHTITQDADANALSVVAGPPDVGAEDSTDSIPLGAVFDVLKNDRRRGAIAYLLDAGDDPIPVGSLAERVAAMEQGTTVEEVTPKERKRVYVSLHQCHLPKMDDLGVVRFDRERSRVELGPAAAAVATYLNHGGDSDGDHTPWHRYYAGITLVGTALLLVATSTTLPVGGVCAGILVAVGLCAGVQSRRLDG